MENLPKSGSHSRSRRQPSPAGKQHLPRLVRSKSGTPATSLLETSTTALSNNNTTSDINQKSKYRSKSTVKTRKNAVAEENNFMINSMIINTGITTQATKKKPPHQDHISNTRDGTYVRFLQRRMPTSPSAWALSPGRVSPSSPVVPPKSPSSGGRTSGGGSGGGGGMSGVLKYFRQKKVASLEELDYHGFKVMHNSLLQWRFANARADTSIAKVKIVAEDPCCIADGFLLRAIGSIEWARSAVQQKKVFNAWVKILALRNSNMRKQVQILKFKHEIKLDHIIRSQSCLLEKWSRLEPKNVEAVSRVVRKLSAATNSLPLINDSKGDVLTICDVFDSALKLFESIQVPITKFNSQVEKSCYLLTELAIIVKQEMEYLRELQKWMLIVASLKEEERSLRAHLIQIR